MAGTTFGAGVSVSAASTNAGNLAVPELDKLLRTPGQPLVRWRQLTNKSKQFGKRSGNKLLFAKVSNLDADPSTGAIVAEGVPLPRASYNTTQGECLCQTSGVASPYTEESDTYSQFSIPNIVENQLSDHSAKALDYRAFYAFDATKIVYTPTGSDAAPLFTWSATGSAGATAARDLQIFDLKNIIDAFKKGKYGSLITAAPVQPWDGVNYFQIASVDSCRAQKDDPEWEKAIYYGDPSRLFDGEEGRIYRCRTIEDNHILGTLTGGYRGQSFFCGKDAVMECVALPEEVRIGQPADFDRDRAVAWVYMGGFSLIWSFNATTEKDNRVVKVA